MKFKFLIRLATGLGYIAALVLAFPPFTQAWGVLVFLTPFIKWAFARPRWRTYLLTGFAAAWAAWALILIWLRHIYPPWGWAALALMSGVLALYPLAWLAAMRWAAPRLQGAPRWRRLVGLLGLAGWWIVLDWVRGWIFTGFPWLPLAAAFWRFPLLLQPAEWTGQWGVTFLIVLFNLGLVCGTGAEMNPGQVSSKPRRKLWWPSRIGPEFYVPALLMFGAVILSSRFILTELDTQFGLLGGPTLRAGIVQPWTPPLLKWKPGDELDNWTTLRDLTLKFSNRNVDIVLWPEAAPPFAMTGPEAQQSRPLVRQLVDAIGKPLLFGAVAAADPAPGTATLSGYYDGIFFQRPGAALDSSYYAKRHLVPFGEYVPLRRWLPFLGKVVPLEGDTLPGKSAEPLTLLMRNGRVLRAGALVCYEDVFPNLAREEVSAGAEFFVVLTNDSWYGTGGGALQYAAHSVLRAVETRRPILRCGNDGWSGVIDENGCAYPLVKENGVVKSGWAMLPGVAHGTAYFRGTGTLDLYVNPVFAGRETFYVRFGDWFVALSALLACAGVVVLRGRRDPKL